MAIPPDPIDRVLPDATAAVVAEVTRVISQDPEAPPPKAPEGASDVDGVVARQVVELRVDEVVFGMGGVWPKAGASIEVEKPAGDYALSAGNKGPFLLATPSGAGGKPVILGRYGPDSYPIELVRHAAKKLGKL